MTYNLPAHGEANWDNKLDPSLQYLKDTAEAAETLKAALADKPLPGNLYFIDPNSPLQIVVGAGIVIGALAAVRANKRFLAVLMVSVTGYGIALMFALQGAPDLALTQMLVESIILVAFVLAMRSLPAELRDRTGGRYRVIRVIIGAAFGITMVFVAIYALGARVAAPVSLQFPKLAYEGGGGLNIVNVTLVDIRAWDTFGEISVLALAATFLRSRPGKGIAASLGNMAVQTDDGVGPMTVEGVFEAHHLAATGVDASALMLIEARKPYKGAQIAAAGWVVSI